MDNTKTFWLPEKASTFADIVDPAFYLFYWISIFFFVLICAMIVIFVVKYIRKRPDQLATAQITHNLKLELTWTLIPLAMVMGLFFLGMKGYLDMRVVPSNFMQVNVKGQKWAWSFEYPSGAINDTLVVPVGTPVKLVMTSRDVLHSFFIPAFRTKADLVPNRYHALWFQATKTGVFPVECTQYCGTSHSYMLTAVKVLAKDAYDAWLASASDPAAGKTPVEYGEILYTKRGCNACHTVDGTPLIGPSWKGMWGKQEAMESGPSILVDAAYIHKSLMDPAADMVAGFPPVMPTFKGILSDKEIDALIAYIQTLK